MSLQLSPSLALILPVKNTTLLIQVLLHGVIGGEEPVQVQCEQSQSFSLSLPKR